MQIFLKNYKKNNNHMFREDTFLREQVNPEKRQIN